jgi:hypothetical protein
MKKFFALLAVAALAFAVGCGGETKKPVKVEKKPSGDTAVTTETKPGETTDVKVDEKGNVEAKTEKPEEKPADEKPAAEEKKADEKPAAEEKKADEKPAEEKKEDK